MAIGTGAPVVAGAVANVGIGVKVGAEVGDGNGDGDEVGDVGKTVAAAVAPAVAAGVSVGAGGRGNEGPGASLAWLTGGSEGLPVADGLLEGLRGLGLVPEGQRLQVAAQ